MTTTRPEAKVATGRTQVPFEVIRFQAAMFAATVEAVRVVTITKEESR